MSIKILGLIFHLKIYIVIILREMVEDTGKAKKLYMKQYYDLNKPRMIKQIMAKQKMIKNSDKYIEDNRDKII